MANKGRQPITSAAFVLARNATIRGSFLRKCLPETNARLNEPQVRHDSRPETHHAQSQANIDPNSWMLIVILALGRLNGRARDRRPRQ